MSEFKERIVYAGIKTATTRTWNRTLPDLEPHFAGRKPHRFQIKDNPFFTLCISELLCRKSRLTVSMSVVGWWPGSSPRGCLPVLPDYRAHRGLLSSGLWNKCERTGRTPRRVPNKVQCGSDAGIYKNCQNRIIFIKAKLPKHSDSYVSIV